MVFDDLNESNYILYAAKAYQRPGAVMSEFEEDMQRMLYLKRLLTKYYSTGVLKDRLIMNHLTVMANVFGLAYVRMLFVKMDEKDLEVLKPFLRFLNHLPEQVESVNGKVIETAEIRNEEEALQCVLRLKKTS